MLAEVQELDRDAPDYDRALAELAAFLQRIAIVQVVPDVALQDEEFDPASLTRLAGAMSREDVQLYYQIALGGRRDLAMAPEPRIGFEMSLLRMLAFRPEAAVSAGEVTSGPKSVRVAPSPSALPDPTPGSAPVRPMSIDAENWPAVMDAANLSGMVRQFARHCVPASFENQVLRLRFDPAVAHRRTPQIEEKMVQCLSAHLGTQLRVVFEAAEATLVTPVRRLALDEQDKMSRVAAAFEMDATVQGLRERFGAQIEASSVKPTH